MQCSENCQCVLLVCTVHELYVSVVMNLFFFFISVLACLIDLQLLDESHSIIVSALLSLLAPRSVDRACVRQARVQLKPRILYCTDYRPRPQLPADGNGTRAKAFY